MPREIRLNAFDMNCVGHIQQGLWTHPRDQSSRYTELQYWMDYAKKLERGLFDGIFFADVVGVYDVYGGNADAALRGAVQVPVNDPTLVIPAMAAVTQHLGFGVTANLIYEQPFLFARRMSTLDHLTGGRIGWNIVTGYLDSAARATTNQYAKIADRLDRIDQRSVAVVETTASLPAATQASAPAQTAALAAVTSESQKLSDRILPDWVVHDVQNGHALVESRYGGLFAVSAGSVLPGIGRVDMIKRQDGHWVVLTARGTITSAR